MITGFIHVLQADGEGRGKKRAPALLAALIAVLALGVIAAFVVTWPASTVAGKGRPSPDGGSVTVSTTTNVTPSASSSNRESEVATTPPSGVAPTSVASSKGEIGQDVKPPVESTRLPPNQRSEPEMTGSHTSESLIACMNKVTSGGWANARSYSGLNESNLGKSVRGTLATGSSLTYVVYVWDAECRPQVALKLAPGSKGSFSGVLGQPWFFVPEGESPLRNSHAEPFQPNEYGVENYNDDRAMVQYVAG
ncbi:hypothetical protein [Lentzea sp. NPDC055074]